MAFTQGHALLIGVGTHKFHPEVNVPITVKDAEAVATVLRDSTFCGYAPEQVCVIQGSSATKAQILSALDVLAQRAGENDMVFLFYCGHGAVDTDGNYYLVSHDARLQRGHVVVDTGVSEAELLAKLKLIQAQRMFMAFNACFSGNISPSLSTNDQVLAASSLSEKTAVGLLTTGSGRIIVTACRETQKSYIGAGPLTIFTQALVDGLRGMGVGNNGGYISAFNLYEYIFATVSQTINNLYKLRQEPELTILNGVGPFAVALYKGASLLGEFDTKQPVPTGSAVHEVKPEKNQRLFNQYVQQSGGINLGQGNKIGITGDIFGGNKVIGPKIDAQGTQGFIYNAQGPVTQNFGTQVDTGGGDFVGRDKTVRGNEVHGDKIGGDRIDVGGSSGSSGIAIGRGAQANVNTRSTDVTSEQFAKLIQELRTTLAAAKLDSDEQEAVQQDLGTIEAQLAKPEPKLSLIKRGLNNVKDVIEAAVGVGTATATLTALVQRGIEMAQQLFK